MTEVTLEQQELPATQDEVSSTEEDGVAYDRMEERPPERNMGARSSQVALQLMALVRLHVAERKLGKTFGPDCGYHLPNETKRKVRFPDGTFIARGRLPEERTPEGNLQLVPDLAVEVVSPNDTAYEVEEKRVAYLGAGVRLVWVLFPPTRTVFVFRGSAVSVLGEGDTLSGEDVLPDFTCPIARIFEDL